MKKHLIILSLLLALCGGCATVFAGLRIASVAFQVVKVIAGAGDGSDQQESEADDGKPKRTP